MRWRFDGRGRGRLPQGARSVAGGLHAAAARGRRLPADSCGAHDGWGRAGGCDLWTCGQLDHRQEQACQVGDSGCGQESGMTSTVDVT